MKKKIKANESSPAEDSSTEEAQLDHIKLIHQLSHQGESTIQILSKWVETNQLLERIAKAEERRNEIAEEEYSDDEEDSD